MECTQPNTCSCIEGWTGSDCLTGIAISLDIIVYILQLFVIMAVVLIWSVHNQIVVPVLMGGVEMIVLQVGL